MCNGIEASIGGVIRLILSRENMGRKNVRNQGIYMVKEKKSSRQSSRNDNGRVSK